MAPRRGTASVSLTRSSSWASDGCTPGASRGSAPDRLPVLIQMKSRKTRGVLRLSARPHAAHRRGLLATIADFLYLRKYKRSHQLSVGDRERRVPDPESGAAHYSPRGLIGALVIDAGWRFVAVPASHQGCSSPAAIPARSPERSHDAVHLVPATWWLTVGALPDRPLRIAGGAVVPVDRWMLPDSLDPPASGSHAPGRGHREHLMISSLNPSINGFR